MKGCLYLGLLALLASPAGAEPSPGGTPEPEVETVTVTGKQKDENKRVCKRGSTTGSIVTTTTCKTKREWDEIRERSLATMDQLRKEQDRRKYLKDMIGG